MNLLEILSNHPKNLIENISRITITYNLDAQINILSYYQLNSILLYFISLNLSKDIQTIEFNIQTNRAESDNHYLTLQIISNLTEFTELENVSITIDKLSSIKISLPNLLYDCYLSSINIIIPELKEHPGLESQLAIIQKNKNFDIIKKFIRYIEIREEEDIPKYNLFYTFLKHFKENMNHSIENIVNYYNKNSYKISVSKDIIVINPTSIDPAILFLILSQILDEQLFHTYNTDLFKCIANLN